MVYTFNVKRFLLAVAFLAASCAAPGPIVGGPGGNPGGPINDDTIMRINPGMTRDEVLRMFGPPRDVMGFPRQRETSWEYLYVDTWGYRSYLYVNFDPAGVVVSRLTRRIDPERSSR